MYKPTHQQIASRSVSSSPSASINNVSPPDISMSLSSAAAPNTYQSSLSIQAPLALSTTSTQSLGQLKDESSSSITKLPPTVSSDGMANPNLTIGAGSAIVVSSSSSGSNRHVRKIVLKKVSLN